jgi:hypothetical protein
MIGVIGAIGYAIATTGNVTKDDVAKASNDAIQKVKDAKPSDEVTVDLKGKEKQ